MSDPLDDVLGEWADPTPPPDFVDQVMAAHQPPARSPRRWPYWAAAATVVLAAGLVLWLNQAPAYSGSLDAQSRQSVTLGAGSAVAEAGAELTWKQVDGVLTAYQPRGAVFYRLAPDQTLRLRTPNGEFVATGACFEMEIDPMSLKTGLMGAALGAGLTAAAFVTVYDGEVSVNAAQGAHRVAAGERARVPAEGPLTRRDRRAAAPEVTDLKVALEEVEAERDALKAEVETLSAAPEDARVRLQAEKRNLQNEVAELKAALEEEKAARRHVEGDPVPFPEDLPEKYTEEGQAQAFREILQSLNHPGGRIDAVDCSEFPCIVHGYVGQREPGQEGHRALFNDMEKAWKGHFGFDKHSFSWSTSGHKDQNGEGIKFSAVVMPRDLGLSKETHAQIHKRMMLRQQQYREANRPE
jgi:hypothetical protein